MRTLNKGAAHQSASPTVPVMDGRGRLVVMTYGRGRGGSPAAAYLLLNVLFGGLPHWLGAEVERTGLTLALVWEPVHRLKAEGGTC